MEIQVRDICQTASGGSYYVKFHAEFDLQDNPGITAKVASTYPDNAPDQLVSEAAKAICDGFETVLNEIGLGATVVIKNLGIHEVDFKIYKFKQATERALQEYLDVHGY